MYTTASNAAATSKESVLFNFADGADLLTRRLLDEIDYGLMLVDIAGHVVLANRAARQRSAEGGALRLVGERVVPARQADAGPFGIALADAVRGRRTLLQIGADDAATSLAVVPIAIGGGEQGALLILGRRQLCETLSVEMYARRHGLTGAEVHVLRALCDGLPPSDIASRFGVTLSTVRTQVAAIRSKTAAASIRELVHQVASLPPIVALAA